jgi:hypothetical protein
LLTFSFRAKENVSPIIFFIHKINTKVIIVLVCVNLRVEVGKFYVRILKIFYSETTGKFTLAMYFYLYKKINYTKCLLQSRLVLTNNVQKNIKTSLQLSSSSIKSTQKSSLSLSVSHIIFSAWRSLSSLSISSFSCSGWYQARAIIKRITPDRTRTNYRISIWRFCAKYDRGLTWFRLLGNIETFEIDKNYNHERVLIWHCTSVFMKSYAGTWQINRSSRNWRNQMTEQYRTIGPEIQGFLSDRRSFYRTCPSVRSSLSFWTR